MAIDQDLRNFIVEKLKGYFPRLKCRVWLFGSRARGDNQDRADFDLAFDVPGANAGTWASFLADVRENAPTLCSLDLVNMADCQEELCQRILQEGKVIYESKS